MASHMKRFSEKNARIQSPVYSHKGGMCKRHWHITVKILDYMPRKETAYT